MSKGKFARIDPVDHLLSAMKQILPETLKQLRNRFKTDFNFDSLLHLYGLNHPGINAELSSWNGFDPKKNGLEKALSKSGKGKGKTETPPDNDERLKTAVEELFGALVARISSPAMLRIGGVPLLVEEFVMPILGKLLQATTKIYPDWEEEPELVVHTKRVAVKGDVKNDTVSDKKLVYESINQDDIQIALANSKNLKAGKETKYHSYNFNGKSIVPNPSEDQGVLSSSKGKPIPSVLSALEIGKFSYNLYMRDEIYKKFVDSESQPWWLKIPLLSPQHCPTGGESLSVIAKRMGMRIDHEGMDISTALRALKDPSCPFGIILPSFLTGLDENGIKAVDFGSIDIDPKWENHDKVQVGLSELTGHSITLLWKIKAMQEYLVDDRGAYSQSAAKKKSDRGSKLLNEIAAYINFRLGPE